MTVGEAAIGKGVSADGMVDVAWAMRVGAGGVVQAVKNKIVSHKQETANLKLSCRRGEIALGFIVCSLMNMVHLFSLVCMTVVD